MKWVGQHIYDFISRFRNDVYLEDISTGTIASGGNLGLDSNNKIVKANTEAGELTIANATDNRVVTSLGGTDLNAEANLTFSGSAFNATATSAAFSNTASFVVAADSGPSFILSNMADDNFGPILTFLNARGGSDASDGDDLGTISFTGQDDGTPTQQTYAQIIAEVGDATSGQEAGDLSFKVAEYDGTLTTGLFLDGDTNADGEIDVTIGAGAASVTTIAGTLTMGSTAFVNNTGVVQVATQGTIDHDSLANFVAAEHVDWAGASAGTIHATNYSNTMGSGFTVSATTDSSATTITQGDDLFFAAGTGITCETTADGTVTITNTVSDTNTMGSGFTVSATTDSNATTITQGDDLFFAAGTGITCETTADGTVTITNTVTDTNTQLSTEQVQDIVGGMVTGNDESGITVAYEDSDGTLDFTVGTLNQNTTGSAATLTTARNIAGVAFDGSADISLNNNAITNGAGYTTNTGDITGVVITTDSGGGAARATDVSGDAEFSILGATGVGVTNSGTTITAVAVPGEIDHDSLNNFVAAEHVDWAGASAGTIHSSNIPLLNQDTSGTAAGLSATLAVNRGGTGQVTAQAAMNALAGGVLSGKYLRGDGADVTLSSLQAGDIPTLNQSTTGQAGTVATIAGLAPNTATTAAAQPNITSLGTLTALDVDHVNLNGTAIVITGDADDTFTITTGAAGATTMATVDDAGEDGHINIFADGDIKFRPDSSGSIQFVDASGNIKTKILPNANDSFFHYGRGASFGPEDNAASTLGRTLSTHNVAGGDLIFSAGKPTPGTTDDIAGGALFLNGGAGKGTGAGGPVFIGVAPAGSSGSSLNSYIYPINVSGAGKVTITTADISGDAFHLDANAAADNVVNIDAGILDIDVTGVTTLDTTELSIAGKVSMPNRTFKLPADGAGNADGDVVYIGTGSTVIGKIYYYKSDGSWGLTNSDDPGTATGWLAVALGTDPDADGMLVRGTVDLAGDIVGTEALGSIIYLDKATTGDATTAAPTATGDIVRVIGYSITTGNANKIWFSPDNTWVEHV